MNREINYISAPLWQGGGTRGTELAPQTLCKLGIIESLTNIGYNVYQSGNKALAGDIQSISNFNQVITDWLLQLRHEVEKSFAQNRFPLVVGGDHTVAVSSVAASAMQYDDLGVIWFDAHGDMNTPLTSPSGHIHGMPLAVLMGICNPFAQQLVPQFIPKDNIFWVGARSLDEGEELLIKQHNLNVYTTYYIHQVGMNTVMQTILNKLKGKNINHIHCSIDVDALDPQLIRATSVPAANGLTFADYNEFIAALHTIQNKIVSADFVEINPLLDDDNQTTSKWSVNAIKDFFNC